MAIYFGNDNIKDIYVGSDKIKEVYYGSEKVWGEVEPIQEGYWVHKDTGVITYFDADADFITDGVMSAPSWKSDCSEVQLPSGVISLGGECFAQCASLTSITLPEALRFRVLVFRMLCSRISHTRKSYSHRILFWSCYSLTQFYQKVLLA